jgi:hypothetical protein
MAIETATTSATTAVSKDNARQFQAIFTSVIMAQVSFEEDSIAAGLASAAVYTGVTGARVGDFVLVAPVSDLGDDISFTAQVTGNDEVTVIAQDQTEAANISAATVGNLNLLVLRVDQGVFTAAASQ